MSEETVTNAQAASESAQERVGDILRKERITRRIALETIAKDLKLNVKYVRALESNDYNDLPAAPYVRVYLRSLAKYLFLDPDEILKKFYKEVGIDDDKFRKDSETKISISSADQEKKTETKPWINLLIVFAVLAIISLIASKVGHGSSGSQLQKIPSSVPQAAVKKPQSSSETCDDSLLGSMLPHVAATAPQSDTSKNTVAKISKDTSLMTFEMKASKDSVWVQVFADGVSWKNWLKPNQSKRFTARDSFNVHVGNNRCLQYTYNGKPLTLAQNDVVVFKLTHALLQPELWTISKWNLVFKNRS